MIFVETGVASIQGHRDTMQDAYCIENGQMGVFDGHGRYGRDVASRLGKRMLFSFGTGTAGPLKAAINAGSIMRSVEDKLPMGYEGGSTATYAAVGQLAGKNIVAFSYVGDSPLYLLDPKRRTSKLLTNVLHTVDNPNEVARMKAAGATVDGPYFWFGGKGLALSRAVGDLDMLPVICEPQIGTFEITGPRVLALGSDGVLAADARELFEYHTFDRLNSGVSLDIIAYEMADQMASKTRDNATILLARLNP